MCSTECNFHVLQHLPNIWWFSLVVESSSTCSCLLQKDREHYDAEKKRLHTLLPSIARNNHMHLLWQNCNPPPSCDLLETGSESFSHTANQILRMFETHSSITKPHKTCQANAFPFFWHSCETLNFWNLSWIRACLFVTQSTVASTCTMLSATVCLVFIPISWCWTKGCRRWKVRENLWCGGRTKKLQFLGKREARWLGELPLTTNFLNCAPPNTCSCQTTDVWCSQLCLGDQNFNLILRRWCKFLFVQGPSQCVFETRCTAAHQAKEHWHQMHSFAKVCLQGWNSKTQFQEGSTTSVLVLVILCQCWWHHHLSSTCTQQLDHHGLASHHSMTWTY